MSHCGRTVCSFCVELYISLCLYVDVYAYVVVVFFVVPLLLSQPAGARHAAEGLAAMISQLYLLPLTFSLYYTHIIIILIIIIIIISSSIIIITIAVYISQPAGACHIAEGHAEMVNITSTITMKLLLVLKQCYCYYQTLNSEITCSRREAHTCLCLSGDAKYHLNMNTEYEITLCI